MKCRVVIWQGKINGAQAIISPIFAPKDKKKTGVGVVSVPHPVSYTHLFEMRVIIFSSASSREMACDELPISKALHTSTATKHGSFSIRAVRISSNCSFLKTSILLSMIDFLSGSRCATLVFEGRNGIAAVEMCIRDSMNTMLLSCIFCIG